MLNYDDLTPSQKKYIDLVCLFYPSIDKTITRTEILAIHDFFMGKRQEDKRFKVGLPNWLINVNKVDVSVYHFPKKGNLYTSHLKIEVTDDLSAEYVEALKEYELF